MKRLMAATLSLALLGGAAAADPRDHQGGPQRLDQNDRPYDQGRHDEGRHDQGRHDDGRRHDNGNHYGQRDHNWRRGERLPQAYWSRGHYVDYRHHHLRRPPRGYQWVEVNDNYVLIALTTGLIAQIIANNR